MTAKLAAWVAANQNRLADRDIRVTFTAGPDDRPKASAWVDLVSESHLVRVTVWQTGECDVSSIRVADGEETADHVVLASEDELAIFLGGVVDRIV